MKAGIIGFGYWGTNLVRNFANLPGVDLKTVVDKRIEREKFLATLCQSAVFSTDPDDIINDPEIDAVVIATPVFTHFDLAFRSLKKGKHVLVEKPMASNMSEALTLIDLASKQNKVLMIDHTYLYTGAVQKMKTLIDAGHIGNIKYFDSTRINLGIFQPDVNVLWDLATHDISILNFLIKEDPVSVQATGISHTNNGIENIAYLTVNYGTGFMAHFNCSWSSPVKIRMMLIGGDKKMIVFNDLEPTEKVKVYDTGYNHKTDEDKKNILVDYRAGDIYIPKLDTREALSVMAADFRDAIVNKSHPVSSDTSGVKVLKILEASQRSIKNKGIEIEIEH
jgi:predicted dehydrogenase